MNLCQVKFDFFLSVIGLMLSLFVLYQANTNKRSYKPRFNISHQICCLCDCYFRPEMYGTITGVKCSFFGSHSSQFVSLRTLFVECLVTYEL